MRSLWRRTQPQGRQLNLAGAKLDIRPEEKRASYVPSPQSDPNQTKNGLLRAVYSTGVLLEYTMVTMELRS